MYNVLFTHFDIFFQNTVSLAVYVQDMFLQVVIKKLNILFIRDFPMFNKL